MNVTPRYQVLVKDWDPSKEGAERHVGCTFEAAIQQVNEQGLLLLPNPTAGHMLQEHYWPGDGHFFVSWVGPLMAYVKYDQSFKEANPEDSGKYVKVEDEESGLTYRFQVPSELRDMKNVALAVPHDFDEHGKPTFEIVSEGKERMVLVREESLVYPIHNFPYAGLRCATEGRFRIPVDYGRRLDAAMAMSVNLCIPGLVNISLPSMALDLKRTDTFIGLPQRGTGGLFFGHRETFGVWSSPGSRAGLIAVEPNEMSRAQLKASWQNIDDTFQRIIELRSNRKPKAPTVDIERTYADIFEEAKREFARLVDSEHIAKTDILEMEIRDRKLSGVYWVDTAREKRSPKLLEMEVTLVELVNITDLAQARKLVSKLSSMAFK